MSRDQNPGSHRNFRYRASKSPKHRKKPRSIGTLVAIDAFLVIISLLIFALFHHVIPRKLDPVGRVSHRTNTDTSMVESAVISTHPPTTAAGVDDTISEASLAPSIESTPEIPYTSPEATPTPTTEPIGYFGAIFADKFTDGDTIVTDTSYQSENLNISLAFYDEQGVQFYVADIYVKDISCFQTAFAKDTYGQGYSEWPADLNERLGGIIAINGDYYGARKDGTIIRNGVLYREDENPDRDMCILFWDGTIETYAAGSFDVDSIMDRGAYQSWYFGPMLLDENGNTMTSFNSDVTSCNPRTALGYFEPGHYCFVVVDGRSDDSDGLTMKNLSLLMYKLGCKQAYNLDGGQTSQMVIGGSVVNNAYKGGRKCSDIIMIAEP